MEEWLKSCWKVDDRVPDGEIWFVDKNKKVVLKIVNFVIEEGK